MDVYPREVETEMTRQQIVQVTERAVTEGAARYAEANTNAPDLPEAMRQEIARAVFAALDRGHWLPR